MVRTYLNNNFLTSHSTPSNCGIILHIFNNSNIYKSEYQSSV
jgi:hypothetical protein